LDLLDCYIFCRNAHVKSVSFWIYACQQWIKVIALARWPSLPHSQWLKFEKNGEMSLFLRHETFTFQAHVARQLVSLKKTLRPCGIRTDDLMKCDATCPRIRMYIRPYLHRFTNFVYFFNSSRMSLASCATMNLWCRFRVHSRWSKMCEERSHWSPSKNKYLKRSTHVCTYRLETFCMYRNCENGLRVRKTFCCNVVIVNYLERIKNDLVSFVAVSAEQNGIVKLQIMKISFVGLWGMVLSPPAELWVLISNPIWSPG
jgi:hypothetical protein